MRGQRPSHIDTPVLVKSLKQCWVWPVLGRVIVLTTRSCQRLLSKVVRGYSEEEGQMALSLLPFWGGANYPPFQHLSMSDKPFVRPTGNFTSQNCKPWDLCDSILGLSESPFLARRSHRAVALQLNSFAFQRLCHLFQIWILCLAQHRPVRIFLRY